MLTEATIDQTPANVYSTDSHQIVCTFEDIPSQLSTITWTTDTVTTNVYAPSNGDISVNNDQTSTLTLRPHHLANLKDSDDDGSVTFTCRSKFGKDKTVREATKEITIFTPSKL